MSANVSRLGVAWTLVLPDNMKLKSLAVLDKGGAGAHSSVTDDMLALLDVPGIGSSLSGSGVLVADDDGVKCERN